jgi:hypothetical protein
MILELLQAVRDGVNDESQRKRRRKISSTFRKLRKFAGDQNSGKLPPDTAKSQKTMPNEFSCFSGQA